MIQNIYNTKHSEQQINAIYNDYDLAYIGKQFSESFRKWIGNFYHGMTPILKSVHTAALPHGSLRYAYRECSITYVLYTVNNGNIIVIQDYNFNQTVLDAVRRETRAERLRLGMSGTAPSTTASGKNPNNYAEVEYYGTLNGENVVLVKRKGISRRKRQLFNYKLCPKNGTPYIMYNQDFYSAYPFENNIATAWGTDGCRYELTERGGMRIIESVNSISYFITETIISHIKRKLYTENRPNIYCC